MMEICLKCYSELSLIGSMMMMTPIENLIFGCRLGNYRWYDHRIGQENRLRLAVSFSKIASTRGTWGGLGGGLRVSR